MKKILYVMRYPLEEEFSIKNKLDGQLKALVNMGHQVRYIAFDHNYDYLVNANSGEKTKILKNYNINPDLYLHTKAYWDIYKSSLISIRKENYDIIYIRSNPFSSSAVKMCREGKRNRAKVIIEIPSFPPNGEKTISLLRWIYGAYSHRCGKDVEKYVDLYAVNGEHVDFYHGIPAINFDNGVEIELIPLRKEREPAYPLHLIGVASMRDWHGYDRIIRGIANLSKETREKIVLDLVGNDSGDGSLDRWKKLVDELSLNKQVIFHGYKTGKDLDDLFEKADCGICSLGLYRAGYYNICILKLREYAARGLPFIYACNDPGIMDNPPFCIRFSNDDTSINVENVISFVNALKKQGVTPQMIRNYAEKYMTWESQFNKIFSAI